MKLIQLNLWQGKLEYQLIQFFQQEKADVLCLQEVIDVPGGDGVIFLTAKEIVEKTGLENIFFSPVFTFNWMNRKANFGNCIISKYPIEKSETIFTHQTFVENLDLFEQEANMRNIQHAVLKLPHGKRLNVLNHHGYRIPHHKNGDDSSLEQCKAIADYVSSLGEPVVLTGDFNLVPNSPSIKQINKVATNLTLKAKLKTTRTPHTPKKEACDYIFVRDVTVERFHASKHVVSDHKALILEFSL